MFIIFFIISHIYEKLLFILYFINFKSNKNKYQIDLLLLL
jgi:hypothetical protein